MGMGFAPIFTSFFSHVPVELTQQEVILPTVWALACCLEETKQQESKREKCNLKFLLVWLFDNT